MKMSRIPTTIAVVLGAVIGCNPASGQTSVPLYDNLGSHGYEVTVREPLAQKYFDQGLRLYYAFNHAEAIRAFEEGARIDPTCAMCYWGIGLAHGPNINAAMDSVSGVAAYQAVRKAVAASGGLTPRERALIEALARRYEAAPPADRAHLDRAYAEALRAAAARFPDDNEIAVLLAESLMDLSPWDYWTKTGEPHANTPEILRNLERTIETNPSHPGACHFYIHAVEAAFPEKAVACAERLASLMPGAGHLVHMPGHIYIRVGRWADAIHANEHAVHADETYIRDQRPGQGVYTAGYYPHNYHFLAFAATMAGQSEVAIEAAKRVVANVTPEVALIAADIEPLLAYHHMALVNFGRWDDVLALSDPPAHVPLSSLMAHFARGVAFAAKGETTRAREELGKVREVASRVPDGVTRPVADIAVLALEGEIAARSGRLEEAERKFRDAVEVEDAMAYMEPPFWFYPVRHSLGKVLIQLDRPAEAEQVYREDLARFPENGWSLLGLTQSLRKQGRTGEAEEVQRRLEIAWAKADIHPPASRF